MPCRGPSNDPAAIQERCPVVSNPYASRITIPCSEAQVAAYHAFLGAIFSDGSMVPSRQALFDVRQINPYSLIIAVDSANEVVGGIELYGLQPNFFEIGRASCRERV